MTTDVTDTDTGAGAAIDLPEGPDPFYASTGDHLNIEEKRPGSTIRTAAGHVAHVQVCGTDRGAVGDDHMGWPSVLDALDTAGYEGILGVESFTGENATIAAAASVWRPLASSQDALAERSLAHLSRLQPERRGRVDRNAGVTAQERGSRR